MQNNFTLVYFERMKLIYALCTCTTHQSKCVPHMKWISVVSELYSTICTCRVRAMIHIRGNDDWRKTKLLLLFMHAQERVIIIHQVQILIFHFHVFFFSFFSLVRRRLIAIIPIALISTAEAWRAQKSFQCCATDAENKQIAILLKLQVHAIEMELLSMECCQMLKNRNPRHKKRKTKTEKEKRLWWVTAQRNMFSIRLRSPKMCSECQFIQ